LATQNEIELRAVTLNPTSNFCLFQAGSRRNSSCDPVQLAVGKTQTSAITRGCGPWKTSCS